VNRAKNSCILLYIYNNTNKKMFIKMIGILSLIDINIILFVFKNVMTGEMCRYIDI